MGGVNALQQDHAFEGHETLGPHLIIREALLIAGKTRCNKVKPTTSLGGHYSREGPSTKWTDNVMPE